MDFLLNPNIAYLFLAGGLIFAALALMAPGSGLLEVMAALILMVAAYCIYNLPINWWALVILFAGAVLFVASIRWQKNTTLLIVAIAALILGSAYLFSSSVWWIPAVDPLLAAVVSIFSGVFFWFVARKVLETRSIRPTHDLEGLIGAIGEAKTDIHEEGSAQVAGELWSARSKVPIPNGARLRVVGREGFILNVEAIDQADS